jgi:hypothetical protein
MPTSALAAGVFAVEVRLPSGDFEYRQAGIGFAPRCTTTTQLHNTPHFLQVHMRIV